MKGGLGVEIVLINKLQFKDMQVFKCITGGTGLGEIQMTHPSSETEI